MMKCVTILLIISFSTAPVISDGVPDACVKNGMTNPTVTDGTYMIYLSTENNTYLGNNDVIGCTVTNFTASTADGSDAVGPMLIYLDAAITVNNLPLIFRFYFNLAKDGTGQNLNRVGEKDNIPRDLYYVFQYAYDCGIVLVVCSIPVSNSADNGGELRYYHWVLVNQKASCSSTTAQDVLNMAKEKEYTNIVNDMSPAYCPAT